MTTDNQAAQPQDAREQETQRQVAELERLYADALYLSRDIWVERALAALRLSVYAPSAPVQDASELDALREALVQKLRERHQQVKDDQRDLVQPLYRHGYLNGLANAIKLLS